MLDTVQLTSLLASFPRGGTCQFKETHRVHELMKLYFLSLVDALIETRICESFSIDALHVWDTEQVWTSTRRWRTMDRVRGKSCCAMNGSEGKKGCHKPGAPPRHPVQMQASKP